MPLRSYINDKFFYIALSQLFRAVVGVHQRSGNVAVAVCK